MKVRENVIYTCKMYKKYEILSFYAYLCTMMLIELDPLINAFGDYNICVSKMGLSEGLTNK